MLPIPGHVLPVIGHDGCAEHCRRAGCHQQGEEKEQNRWWHHTTSGTGLRLMMGGGSDSGATLSCICGHCGGRLLHTGPIVLIIIAIDARGFVVTATD